MWTPTAYWNSWANKSGGQVFSGYSLHSKQPPFSWTQAQSNHKHSSQTRHCRTAWLMMSWLKWCHSLSAEPVASVWRSNRSSARLPLRNLVTFLNYSFSCLKTLIKFFLCEYHHTSLWTINITSSHNSLCNCSSTCWTFTMETWHFLQVHLFKLLYLRNWVVYFVETWIICVK